MLNARAFAAAYAVFALLALLILAPAMPPFQNADEFNHALRADQVSHFGLLSQRLPDGEQGGWVDAGLIAAQAPFRIIPFHPAVKLSRAMYAPQEWGGLVMAGFPNTGIYPPYFYLPAAMTLAAGRALRVSPLHAVMAARIATGLTSLAIGALAVLLAEGAAPWLFAVLLLPMSLSLTASVSQDSLLFATSALAASLCLRLWRNPMPGGWLAAALALAALSLARPPYAILALALLGADIPLRSRLAALAVAWLPVLFWSLVTAPHILLPVFPAGAVNPALQAKLLLHPPWRIFTVLAATWHAYGTGVLQSFIGQLGWLDVPLPNLYRRAAWLILAAAAWASFGGFLPRISWLALAGVAGAVLGVAVIQYFVWTPPGRPLIEGWVGRYFIPPALMLAAAISPARLPQARALRWAVMLFPVVTIPVTLHAVLLRYYV